MIYKKKVDGKWIDVEGFTVKVEAYGAELSVVLDMSVIDEEHAGEVYAEAVSNMLIALSGNAEKGGPLDPLGDIDE